MKSNPSTRAPFALVGVRARARATTSARDVTVPKFVRAIDG